MLDLYTISWYIRYWSRKLVSLFLS